MKNHQSMIKISTAAFLAFIVSCTGVKKEATLDIISDNVANATQQLTIQTDLIEASGKFINPRTINKSGEIHYVPIDDWCSGFFPGTMWYIYKLTNDEKWKGLAEKYTVELDSVKYLKWHHDVGFMIGSSYLNGIRFGNEEAYKEVVVTAARSLATRYRPAAKVIQSWDTDKGWQSKRGWECPVIIDNMMNLELLFEASLISNDPTFHDIAVNHANTTLANHFRSDNSCYHVVDYSLTDGSVRHKQTAQGYADESSWARGQAWAIYGFTVCYRYTHDQRYLDQAVKVYDFIFNNPNLPKDLIPYWDYNAPNIPNEPRDVSAAAVTACALYEMSAYLPNTSYKETADKIIETLSTPAYRATIGSNGNFILKHSVGSIPHGQEIDVPLNYADYYFLEALVKKQQIQTGDTSFYTKETKMSNEQ